jgi:hypothetical protein
MKLSKEQIQELSKNEKFMDVLRDLSVVRFPDIDDFAILETMLSTVEFVVDHVNEFMRFLGESGDGDWDYLKWRLENDFGIGAKFNNE